MCYPYIARGKKSLFVFSSLERGVLTFPTHNGWQLSRLFMSIDFTVIAEVHGWFNKDGATLSMMSVEVEERKDTTSGVTWNIYCDTFLRRTKQGCPGLNRYLCYSFPLKWQLCYLFAIPFVNGNDLSVEVLSQINKIGLSHLGSDHFWVGPGCLALLWWREREEYKNNEEFHSKISLKCLTTVADLIWLMFSYQYTK